MTRKILTPIFLFIIILLFGVTAVSAQSFSLSFFPAHIIQGEPLLVQIDGATEISSIKKLSFDGKRTAIFMYQGKPAAFIGIDLNKKPGAYELMAEFSNGNIIKKIVDVAPRKKVEAPLGIPEKLGGNTEESQKKLVATLNDEKKSLAGIHTGKKAFWNDKFIPPLKQIFVTDDYGYSRITGAYSIPHKGVDYRAQIGTEVMAVNRGVVRITKTYRNYGKTIVVDHGLGLMTFYLHLSKIKVGVGDLVKQGQIIGLSGQTGYAEGPHLHLSVRIDDVSIDPEKFFELFK